mgnify:FL=1
MALSTPRKALYALIVSVLTLGVLEALCWPIAPAPAPAGQDHQTETAMRASALLGWEAIPGPSKAFGVRSGTVVGPEGTRAPPDRVKPAGGLRLLTLGDSTIYGVLVPEPDVFSNVAAARLSRTLSRPVDAVNGGIPGYSSEQARRLYEHRLQPYMPDVVLIAAQWSDSQLGPMPDAMRFPERGAPVRKVLQTSALVRFIGGLLHGWVPGQDVGWKLQKDPGTRRVPLSAYRSNLNRIADLAEAQGARPVFLLLPSDRDQRRQPLEAPRPEYRAAMTAVAADRGALIIDGIAPFTGRGGRLMSDDVHPSPQGHRLLGETVADALLTVLREVP